MSAVIEDKTYGISAIKSGLLLFWGCWFSLAFLTNFFDLAGTNNLLPAYWHFRSGNLALITSVINIYSFSYAWANLLFIIDIIIQGSIAVLFLYAAMNFWMQRPAWKWVNTAFGISLALWATFILMDEFFIAYNYESTHMALIMAELLTIIAIHFLPEK